MPVFESAAMIPPQTRREALTEVRAQLDTVSGSILNIRVGGNDLSHAFGLRRPANRTIYDLRPVADILIDIVAAFGTQYVVSGPVWEYYSGEGWEEGLRREMELDLLNGFTGKTVIPFATSSSSGMGQSGSLLADMAGTGEWQEGQRFSSGVSSDDVQSWVNGLGL